ncbi:hypothetical protein [Bradyrhizobium elkanii]|uniref:hypothetical protein n=1 Tax=Bradyrhizobium elkanii TaxID=29448 RepID=UPI001AE6030E|nr:hypothetical protein [Bradyrhizobium elkanii]MBP2434268.1 hypothetical protein [Bradyrhizobium elkanii]WLA88831.1 hypothetical protein QNJ96_27445 [Bradyrhizobium elkanii]
MKDAFDKWWEWAGKPLESDLAIPVEIWRLVSELSPEDRLDRLKVNEAVEAQAGGSLAF